MVAVGATRRRVKAAEAEVEMEDAVEEAVATTVGGTMSGTDGAIKIDKAKEARCRITNDNRAAPRPRSEVIQVWQ